VIRQQYQRLRKTRLYERWLGLRMGWQSGRYNGLFDEVRRYVLFLGHGRSSHSLVAALLDAHPQIIMADELDSLRYIEQGWNRAQLFTLITQAAQSHAGKGRQKGAQQNRAYSYQVPGQWQGREKRPQVIGEASLATARLYNGPQLLERVGRCVSVPIQFIQVVRNPYDGISRLSLVSNISLEDASRHYFWVCERVAAIRQNLPADDVFLVRNETLIQEPDETLTGLCGFLGVEAAADYRQACATILFKKPNQVRQEVKWTPALIARVADQIPAYDFLSGYRYDA
jgi:hypothetical protein